MPCTHGDARSPTCGATEAKFSSLSLSLRKWVDLHALRRNFLPRTSKKRCLPATFFGSGPLFSFCTWEVAGGGNRASRPLSILRGVIVIDRLHTAAANDSFSRLSSSCTIRTPLPGGRGHTHARHELRVDEEEEGSSSLRVKKFCLATRGGGRPLFLLSELFWHWI